MPLSSDDLQLTAPAPAPVMGVSAQITGPPGLASYYYWWVAHYPIGVSVVSVPLLVRSAPSPLTATNFVTITGQAALGATTYDLLRTIRPQLPSGTANIAVATALTLPTFNDQGAALSSYNVAGLAAGAPVSEFIVLNNRDYAQPTLVFSPWPQAVQGLIFPDGTTQSTAGISAAQIYSWQQDVQANLHQLLGLGTLELVGGTFGYNLKTTGFAGVFPAGALLINNETTGLTPLAINQAGDVWIGGIPTAGQQSRLFIATTSSYTGSSINPSIYCYNPVGPQGTVLVLEATTAKASFNAKNTAANYFVGVSGTAGNGVFSIIDANASPGNRIIIQAGKIGFTTGVSFVPAHLLELNADDAAKPTTNTWTISSDIRTKRNVRPLEGGMSVIDVLEPIVAEYNGLASTPEGSRVVSFDPERLAPILPDAVRTFRGKLQPEDEEETDLKGVNNHEVIFHLVLAVQQLSAQLKELEANIAVGA